MSAIGRHPPFGKPAAPDRKPLAHPRAALRRRSGAPANPGVRLRPSPVLPFRSGFWATLRAGALMLFHSAGVSRVTVPVSRSRYLQPQRQTGREAPMFERFRPGIYSARSWLALVPITVIGIVGVVMLLAIVP